MKLDNSIETAYRHLSVFESDEYMELYESFEHARLRRIFSTLHNMLISNFEAMNKRLPTEKSTAHFWADNSRELLTAFKSIRDLERSLQNTRYSFKIDDYYDGIIRNCEGFLKEYLGSEIPQGMERIGIFYTIPIFVPRDTLQIENISSTITSELKHIGEGSYANVYKYKDPNLNRLMVLKRAKSSLSEKELVRFKQEFEFMKTCNSIHVVDVYQYDDEKNEYTMEYLDSTLFKYIKVNNDRMAMKDRIFIVRQIIRGLNYIHKKGTLHRDVSPHNMLIKKYDDFVLLKLSDFGEVKLMESNLTSAFTELRGIFNDPALRQEGYENYGLLHEIYATTYVICYVMSGTHILSNVKSKSLRAFVEKGTNPDKQKRFQSFDELNRDLLELSE